MILIGGMPRVAVLDSQRVGVVVSASMCMHKDEFDNIVSLSVAVGLSWAEIYETAAPSVYRPTIWQTWREVALFFLTNATRHTIDRFHLRRRRTTYLRPRPGVPNAQERPPGRF